MTLMYKDIIYSCMIARKTEVEGQSLLIIKKKYKDPEPLYTVLMPTDLAVYFERLHSNVREVSPGQSGLGANY